MHLTLTNFRSFSNRDFDLSDDFILLSGKSGAGKTTILIGIIFALTGEGKKLVKHGCKGCKVTLKIEDIIITRTKNPNRLEVISSSRFKYEDKIAQSMIDSRFKNIHLGYISQRLYKSFILMTPTDKLKYIEEIALDKDFITRLQQKCKELIKQRKRQLDIYQNEKITREAVLKDMAIADIDYCKDTDESIDILMGKKKSIENAIVLFKNNIKQQALIDQLQHEIDSIKIDVSIEEITRQRIHLSKWETYMEEKQKLKSMDRLDDDINMDDIEEMMDDMKQINRLNNCISKLGDVQSDLDQILSIQEKSATKYICPSCSVSLGLFHGSLIKTTTMNTEIKSITYDQARQIEKKKQELLNDLHEVHALEKKKQELLENYGDEIDPQTQMRLLSKQKMYIRQKQVCEEVKVEKPQILFTVKDVEKVYEKQEKQKLLNSIRKNYIPSQYTLEELTKQLNSIDSVISGFHWEKVRTIREKIKAHEISTSLAIKLQEIIAEAERSAITETINTLNLYVQFYISKFTDNIQVYLIFDGVRLTTNVLLNDHETDINSLSGGEIARVILAFTLALAEMHDIKLLMLDESVASLDQETTTTVIDTIKSNYIGKVICIAHQTMTGIFDKVIEL